jgi:hypothetical protein
MLNMGTGLKIVPDTLHCYKINLVFRPGNLKLLMELPLFPECPLTESCIPVSLQPVNYSISCERLQQCKNIDLPAGEWPLRDREFGAQFKANCGSDRTLPCDGMLGLQSPYVGGGGKGGGKESNTYEILRF